MAIELIKISEFPESVDTKDWFVVGDVNGVAYKLSKENLEAELGINALMQFGGAIIPTSTPEPTGDFFWVATEEGTYTNFGGVVVPASSLAVISRVDGMFTSSVTAIDVTANGVVEEGEILAPSGGEVYDKTIKKYYSQELVPTGKNLLNKATVKSNTWLETSTGEIQEVLTNHKISDYIPVRAGLPYSQSGGYSGGNNRVSIFANIGDTIPVQYITNQITFTPNINGFAVIMVGSDISDMSDTFQLEQNSSPTSYEPFNGILQEKLYETYLPDRLLEINVNGEVEENNTGLTDGDTVYKAIEPISSTLDAITTRENFFDKTAIVPDQLLNVPAGTPLGEITVEDAAGWSRSYPVKLEEGDYKILGINIGENAMFAGLFPTASLVGGDTQVGERVYNNIFSVTGTKYLSFSVESPSYTANLDVIQIKKLSSSDEYVAYDTIVINPSALPESDNGKTGGLEVFVDSNIVRVRSDYDATTDLVQEYQYQNYPTTNGVFSGSKVYLIQKGDSISGDLSANLVHDISDSISPMGTSQYWFIAGQHGYYIARATSAGNTFTAGQEVKDNLGREFTVIHVAGNMVYLAPKITVSGQTITRSWNQGSSGFTSLSTMDDSYSNPVTSVSGYQLKPMMEVVKQSILIDGKTITDTGIYKGDTVELIDKADCIDPIGAIFNGLNGISGNTLMTITQSYFFKGKSVYLSSNLNMASWLPFIKYHGIQPLGLMPTGGYTPYAIIPKVNPFPSSGGRLAVDWNYPTDINDPLSDKYTKYLYNVDNVDLVDETDVPDRTIQFLSNGSDFKLGFASGLDLEAGLTAKDKRPDYTTEAFHIATNVSNKMYFRALTSGKFPNGVLPESFFGQFNGYFCYYAPEEDVQAYVVHAKSTSYVYIHLQKASNKELIVVDGIEGSRLEIVESKGIELLSDKVIDNEVYVKTTNADANYMVLKTT